MPPSKAFLSTCPVDGFSNQLLALFAAAALAHDLGGLPFWIPPFVVDNLVEQHRNVPEAKRASFCALCYEHVARARTIPADELVNVSRIEAVGGVRFPASALVGQSFHRSRVVLDVCKMQLHGLVFGGTHCEPPDRVGAASMGARARIAAQGAATYACVREGVSRSLLNASSTAAPLWVRVGSAVRPYFRLCGSPPRRFPALFEPSVAVLAVSDGVWPRVLRRRTSLALNCGPRRPAPEPPKRTERACAHIRLSLPGEPKGWDKLGSEFTEAIPEQVVALRKWLAAMLPKQVSVLILSDAPWLLQRLIPELGDANGCGCMATGRCVFAESVLDNLIEEHARVTNLACSVAGHLLLTPSSTFSTIIRLHALRRAQPTSLVYTQARVDFQAPAATLPLLSQLRRCAGAESREADDEARKVCIVAAVVQALRATSMQLEHLHSRKGARTRAPFYQMN
ncbi:hypothetical protein KFE25_012129 [Diacronema lutheri]|uniref:Uncharacterized protein n=1 Tax=Diacronema lutheri TaxID=2081491 RepID=A0A8J6C6X7_DIALT|nr:hypothetical protein KFE25_012129 [Diacronema lutheri]